jgi:GT2 family glycosyltransferase/peptidoglycan/xylan/chitin deacetylase (PgdA/CDA1 family)
MTTIVPVLLYHRVSDDAGGDEFAVSRRAFHEHVAAIKCSGRVPLSISELAEGLRDSSRLPARPVAITFDDGYQDTSDATSELCEAGLCSTVYVTTGAIGVGDRISVDQIRGLASNEAGVEIGAHSVSHRRLDELGVDDARREIRDSKAALESVIERAVASFAYPHGAYDSHVRELVIAAGFSSAAAVKNALSHESDDHWAIARWTVTANASANQIEELLAGRGAVLAWRRERARTRAYRSVRRTRRRLTGTDSQLAGGRPALASSPLLSPSDAPVAVGIVDVARGISDVVPGVARSGAAYRKMALLVRNGAQPLGWVTSCVGVSGTVTSDEVRRVLSAYGCADVPARTDADATQARPVWPALAALSVVLTTCADSDSVVCCAGKLLEHGTGEFEVIVVENRPEGSPVESALRSAFRDDDRVRYVEEQRQGLSYARNAGLLAATGAYVAFLDDDVVIDTAWMGGIREAFAYDPDASCVTGPILPRELETSAQILLEQFASFSKGFERRKFCLQLGRGQTPLFPYAAGHIGSGANMSFETAALRELGGFDPVLGTGTVARGGEDLDILVRLIHAGRTILYEPRAMVWHRHPPAMERLRRQAFGYGVGLGAMLTKQFLARGSRIEIVRLVPSGLWYLLSSKSRKNASKAPGFPRSITLFERLGMAVGPVAYVSSRRRASRLAGARTGAKREDMRSYRVWSGELEWTKPILPGEPLRTADGESFDSARLLVRVSGEPVGFIQVPLVAGTLAWPSVAAAIRRSLGPEIDKRAVAAALAPAAYRGLVSIIVCTRERPDRLRRCLEALTATAHRDVEIVVVDNAPRDAATAEVVAEIAAVDGRVKYVCEPRAGLSRARNLGLRTACGEFVAFTDDDVRVDPRWVDGVLRGFQRRADVACVTGLVASASLERPAERFFDERVWWSSSCEQHLYDAGSEATRLHPYAAGICGTGANMAFRRATLEAVGGFDETLGAGSPTSGGEDLDIFLRLMLAGWALSYEPSALVWHDHRVALGDLEAQMYGYGKGLAAYLCKYLLSRSYGPDIATRIMRGGWHFAALTRRSRAAGARAGLGVALQRAEWRGMIAGVPAYLKSRRQQSRAHLWAVAPRSSRAVTPR